MQSYELAPPYQAIDTDFCDFMKKNPSELYSFYSGFKAVCIAVDKKHYKVLYRGFDYKGDDSIINRPVWKCAFKCNHDEFAYAVRQYNNMVEFCCGQPPSPLHYYDTEEQNYVMF